MIVPSDFDEIINTLTRMRKNVSDQLEVENAAGLDGGDVTMRKRALLATLRKLMLPENVGLCHMDVLAKFVRAAAEVEVKLGEHDVGNKLNRAADYIDQAIEEAS